MSSPDILVLNRFLDDYLEIRQATWHSTTAVIINAGTQLKNAGTKALSKISASLPFFSTSSSSVQSEEEKIETQDDETIITNICNSLKELFSKAQTIENWINIIFDLGDQARQALLRSKSSLLCQTLHAMRTYIIYHLQEEADFKAHLLTLRENKEALELEILDTQLKGLAITDLEIKRDMALYNLADLGDDQSIFECARFGLFQLLTFPPKQTCHELSHTRDLAPSPEINIHKPWYYQKNNFLLYHDKQIKPIKMEKFNEFEERAKRKGKLIVKALDASDSTYTDGSQGKKVNELSINPAASPLLMNLAPSQTPPPLPLPADKLAPKIQATVPAVSLLTSANTPKTSDKSASKEEEKSRATPTEDPLLTAASESRLSPAATVSLFSSTGSSKKNKKKGKQQQNQAQPLTGTGFTP